MNLSVIICAHNPRADYFSRVLDSLKAQSLPVEAWELIIVDNASTPPLTDAWALDWHPGAKIVREEKLGLAHARKCGMHEAAAELLVFVDDDTVLAADYLAQAAAIAAVQPGLGVWGSGNIAGAYERPLPGHLKPYLSLLSVRASDEAKTSPHYPAGPATPWGAGLCVRTKVANGYLAQSGNDKLALLGRTGGSLAAGEDEEICLHACNEGWRIGVFPELKITHLIPAARLEDDYFLRAAEGSKLAGIVLAYKAGARLPPHPFSPIGLWRLAAALLKPGGFERRMRLASMRGVLNALRLIKAHRRMPS